MKITSAGGDVRYAIEIAKLIKSNRAEIFVGSYCVSACAQFLLPAAKRIVLGRDSFVGFHTTPADLVLPADAAQMALVDYQRAKSREEQFYQEYKLDAGMLGQLRWMVRPVCRLAADPIHYGDLRDYGIASEYTVVAPSRQILEEIGYPTIQGDLPSDPTEAKDRARRAGFNDRFTVRFVDEIEPFTSDALPLC